MATIHDLDRQELKEHIQHLVEVVVDPAFYAFYDQTLNRALSHISDPLERDRFATQLADISTRWRDRAVESAIEITLMSHDHGQRCLQSADRARAEKPPTSLIKE